MTDANFTSTDTLIAGAGPTAYAASLVAAACGYDVTLVAPKGTPIDDDARTTALMRPGVALLQDFGVWDAIAPETAPLQVLRIVDATGRLLRAPTVDFHAQETGADEFGFNIPNRVLNARLADAVDENARITIVDAMVSAVAFDDDAAHATLSNGKTYEAKLVVGADGVQSLVRRAAEIGERTWAYPQTAIVCAFDHERSHNGVSAEFHTKEGPFTQVPLPGNRSSLVWVMKPENVDGVLALEPEALAAAIEKNLQHTLGAISNVSKPQPWPLSTLVANKFGGDRVMLVGHAAHAFPPIGAQGLNLGFRDIEDLGAVLEDAHANGRDPGAAKTTQAYDRRRRADIYVRTGAVDALNRSLLTDLLPVQAVRAVGLSALKNVSPLRTLFMREGVQPGSGLRSLFT